MNKTFAGAIIAAAIAAIALYALNRPEPDSSQTQSVMGFQRSLQVSGLRSK